MRTVGGLVIVKMTEGGVEPLGDRFMAAGWGNRPMNRLRRKKAETVLSEELNRPMKLSQPV